MFVIWSDEASSRMDFVEIGAAIRGRLHNGSKPDIVLVVLDEIDAFVRMRGKTGLDDYRDFINEAETCLSEDGRIVQIDEYYTFAQYPESSDFKANQLGRK